MAPIVQTLDRVALQRRLAAKLLGIAIDDVGTDDNQAEPSETSAHW